jgi:dTDP-4-amino-4,6-dideoxygalactose transaminase
LDELQAAFLRVKLRYLDEWNARRQTVAHQYLETLGSISSIALPHVAWWAEPVWHLFVVRHPQRDALRESLAEAGVVTLIHYPIPPHLSKAYAAQGWRRGDFPLTEDLAMEVLSLPIGPHSRSSQVLELSMIVKRSIHNAG